MRALTASRRADVSAFSESDSSVLVARPAWNRARRTRYDSSAEARLRCVETMATCASCTDCHAVSTSSRMASRIVSACASVERAWARSALPFVAPRSTSVADQVTAPPMAHVPCHTLSGGKYFGFGSAYCAVPMPSSFGRMS
jgi:hypothetical protein